MIGLESHRPNETRRVKSFVRKVHNALTLNLAGCFPLGLVEFINARIRSSLSQRNDPVGLICCLVPTNGDGERPAIVGSIIVHAMAATGRCTCYVTILELTRQPGASSTLLSSGFDSQKETKVRPSDMASVYGEQLY